MLQRDVSTHGSLKEIIGVYLVVSLLALAISRVPLPFFQANLAPALLGLLFLGSALHMSKRSGDLAAFGLELGGLFAPSPEHVKGWLSDILYLAKKCLPLALRELGIACLVALVVFPPFASRLWLLARCSTGFYLAYPIGRSVYAGRPANCCSAARRSVLSRLLTDTVES